MLTQSLNGAWWLCEPGQDKPMAATVPGCVHTDLLAAGRIEDPYFRDNELATLWVGETDWTYTRRFMVDQALLAHSHVLLRCHGLDTLATIWVNSELIATTDNMYRTYEFDVRELLQAGENTIEVRFAAAMHYVRAKGAERNLPAWGVGDHKLDGGGWIRKEPCNFGWDWGPKLVTCGIWQDIELVAFETRLSDIYLEQEIDDGHANVMVQVQAEGTVEQSLVADLRLSLNGAVVVESQIPLASDGMGSQIIQIKEPQLWWPRGMGKQPLYDLDLELRNAEGKLLDQDQRRIGLRSLRLVRKYDAWGQSFRFEANGVPFFAKGANWIPDDTFATRLTDRTYKQSLQDAVDANMNMLRVWGGGLYESDRFYDLCDEMGLCVWQDFIFGCATYPTFNASWMANFLAEASDNVRRLRHHTCLALWCGNNELEQGLVGDEWTDTTMSWVDYCKLYDDALPELLAELDPQRDYWPSSAHTPVGDRTDANDPRSGDAHLWSVWHGKMPFEWYRTCGHRFNSEFGFQSFPEPKTVHSYTETQDRNITSYVMEHHQRSGIGNSTIMTYMLDWFRLPVDFDNVLWASQILQGMAIKYAVEHWRRSMPRGMGTLYWQLNDCWPVASWSSVDSFGRWKALHYMARHFYESLLISGLEDADAGTIQVHVTSDLLSTKQGHARWLVTDVAGAHIEGGATDVEICANSNTHTVTLDLSEQLGQRGSRDILVWLELEVEEKVVSTNLVTFARPKHLNLLEPELVAEVSQVGPGEFLATISSKAPALWAWVELADSDARLSDNFVHVRQGEPWQISITPTKPLTLSEVREQLIIRSLIDTYRE